MKKQIKSLLVIPFLALSLGSCSGGGPNGPTYATGDTIYESELIFDLTDKDNAAVNASVKVAINGTITEVSCGKYDAELSEIGYKDGILTLSNSFLSKIPAGEKDIKIVYGDSLKTSVPALICTKVIKTAQDFQNINENLTGIYALGNDIDLSSIDNFEPLGYYFTETSTSNAYFHGILEGNGYAIKNAKVYWSDLPNSSSDSYTSLSYPSNQDVYKGNAKFSHASHTAGDNIGLFQVIGSSGVVRNCVFDNVKVRGRTIVGVIAGNVMGTVQNCLITSTCSVQLGTHFYDDDCNAGGAFGIVAGSGTVSHCVSLTSNLSVIDIYQDYGPDYAGKTGNGWDHPSEAGNTCNWWRQCGVDKEYAESTGLSGKETDSNGSQTNGIYSFAGKCWGSVSESYAIAFTQTPFEGTTRDVYFGQTHLGINKPTSGDSDMGSLTDCESYSLADMKVASNLSALPTSSRIIADGSLPSLICPNIGFEIAQ